MPRRAVTLTETLVACLVLTSMVSLVSTTLIRLDRQRRITEYTRIALDELSNQLDRLTLLPADELSAALPSLRVISAAAERLPDPRLSVRLTPGPWGSRLAVSLSWHGLGGKRERPLTLVAWLPDEDAPPPVAPALKTKGDTP